MTLKYCLIFTLHDVIIIEMNFSEKISWIIDPRFLNMDARVWSRICSLLFGLG